MNKKIRMFQALLIVTILLLQMIIPIVPIYAKTSENIWKETFENGVDGWKFFDADGDSDNWNLLSSNESGFKPYRGNYLLASDSLNRTPDNYAVSPAIDIPAEKVGDMEALNLSWYRSALSGYSFAEQYTVYVYKGNSEDPSLNEIKANSEQIYNETIRYGEEYGKIKIDFTAYKGETIRLVFRHHDCPNLQALMIDDISIDASYTNASQTSFGFEDENAGWSFIDADGDGFNWFTSKVYPYEGRKSIVSDSYRRRECNPKNYAISPIIDVSGKTHLQLDWYAGASSESNYKEHYAVYIYPYNNEEDSSKVPTVEDISKLTPVFEEKLDTYEYTKKTVDLNKYINYDKIRVIFYHYIPDGGSAQASLIIDSISITGIGGASHTAKFFVDGTLFNSQLYTEGSSILSPVPIPGKAGYTFVGWEPEVKVMGTEDIAFNAVFSESTAKLENIKIAKQPTKLEYAEGENFDRTGMEVKACYSDGTEVGVTNYCEITNGENLTKGQTNVTIKYREDNKTVETTQTITVKEKSPVAQKTLESIKITTPPTKTVYPEGEKFNPEGMKVTATYSDKTEKEVTDYTYTPEGELKTTDTAITISYKEGEVTKTATQTITVTAKTPEEQKTLESIKITTAPTKTEYTEGENFDKAGMEVKACYSDKTEAVITNYQITNGENLTKDQTSVTIRYAEGEKTVEVAQKITVKAEDPNAEKTIQFKDENLYNEIKSILGKKIKTSNDEELTIKATKKDIEGVTQISPEKKVDDISGIGNFTGLKLLSLQENNLSDISEVEKLTNLTHLSISHTQVEDIKAVSKLTNLKLLNIEASKVTDISGLKDLVNLNELDLLQNNIENIDVVKNFKNLQILRFGENKVRDISAISELSNLEKLWISNNQISDANPIQKLPNLKYYGLENQQVTKYILKTQKEVELPPIFTQAKDKNSKIYTEKEYEFTNCKLNEDGTKVILTTVGENATVKISGGKADGTTLNIIAVDEIPKELTSIEIAIHPGKFIYTEGEDFDTTGLKVEAKYSDGSSKELKEGEYEIVDGKNLKLGQETVTIRYTEGEKTVETTQKVGVTAKTPEIPKTLESIKITTAPTKTTYTEGEKFDKAGMKVTATYSDGTTKEVTDYTYTPAGELKTTDKTITVSYKEGEKTVEAKYTITVKAKPPVAQKTLESIKVTTAPTRTTYTEGEKFDKTGMKVIAKYSDGTTKEVTDYTYTPAGELKTTDKTITVSYKEGEKTVEAKYTITVKAKPPVAQKTLESIKVTTAPTRTTYTEGEKFDKTGMKVIAKYSDGTTKEVTDYTYTPAGELKTTDKTITVSYKEGEKTVEAKYTITVKAKPPVAQKTLESIKVTTAPTRTTYTEGEKFDKTGMKVIAKYSDGTTKEVTDYTYTPAGELKTTDKTITVSYTENEVTKTATQEITVVAKGNSGDEPGGETEKVKLDSIEIKEAPTKTVYTEGEKFDKTGMKVIAKYSDGTTKEIKNYAYTPAGALTKKDTTITVSYTENGVTKTDTQKIKIQNKDDGTGAKDKFPDTGAQIPIISGIVLMFAVAVASVVKIKRLTGI